MNDVLGVMDETYAALFDTFLSGAVGAAAFRSQFYATMTSDARLGDDVRYAILQRVSSGGSHGQIQGTGGPGGPDLPDGTKEVTHGS